MRLKFIAVAFAALLLGGWQMNAAPADPHKDFKTAVTLYERGLYNEARSIFEDLSKQEPDVLTDGYIVLCALKTRAAGYESILSDYESRYIKSTLSPEINLLYGNMLFDDGKYAAAAERFAAVPSISIDRRDHTELLFKQAYCDYGVGDFPQAVAKFKQLEAMPYSDYTSPSRYSLGYIEYNNNNFQEAYNWFSKCLNDERFALNARYYMLECRFMQKDYRYVVDNGEAVYAESPQERKGHLSRILSESYLVLGNAGKAKEYYDANAISNATMNRSDYFYAGSLQYALGDYQGAIDNYSLMTMRTDSLGQIANYQMGYSYIQTKDKVKALAAFEQAAAQTYDRQIQEDAYFNYAKLAFDINHDTSAFKEYLSKFPDSGKQDLFYNYIALGSLANQDYAAAVEAYDNIEHLDGEMRSNYMKANYLRARQLIQNGAWKDAISCLRAATFFTDRQDNFNKLARYWLAQSYYYTDNYNEAIDIFNDLYNLSALENEDEGKMIPYDLAYSYFKKADYTNASKWFDRFINSRNATNRQDALVRRADCDFLRKDYKNAVTAYQKAISEYPDVNYVYPYYQMGLAYGLNGDNNAKINALSKVTDASPSAPFYSEALYELGRSYVTARNDSRAMECFSLLQDTSRDSTFIASALIEMGMIYRNRADYDRALELYKQVVEKMPGSGSANEALLAIESIYQTKGEPDKYILYVAGLGNPSLNKTEEETQALYFNSAEQIFLSGNYEKAITSLDKYLAEYPQGTQRAQAEFYLAECYKNLGRKEKALDYYKRVANSSGSDSFKEAAILNFSNISYELEKYNDAFEAYSSLLSVAQLENNVKTARVGMMRSAYKAKNYSGAIRCADAIASSFPEPDLAREAQYIKAKSYLESSQRDSAYDIFRQLAQQPSTAEGAEAAYLIIEDLYNRGSFSEVPDKVYAFANDAPGQGYWLAKAYIILGDSFAEQDNYRQARATFESVLNGYKPAPGKTSDDVTEAVRMRLEKLNQLNQ
ncbi:MAG: tetratricopeptide repeat protein [Bacteroidales bacterium]|nr:tetratricopeptide repeat protein [Bacteroidales bacterium]